MDTNKKILIVDDDLEIQRLLATYLRQNQFDVQTAGSGREMDQRLAHELFDLLILDLMLPDENGLDICRRLQGRSKMPIIMLTARGHETDRIVGLEMGADDYLPKPFSPRELLARIRVVLRRIDAAARREEVPRETTGYRFAGWNLDVTARQLLSPEGVVVPLSGGEFKLLQMFLDHPGRVLSRDTLMDWMQGRENMPFDRSIDVQVSRVRQRLGDSGKEPQLLKTVRGEGYQLAVPVEVVAR